MQQWTMQLPRTLKHDGRTYRIDVIGFDRSDGTWEGRIQFMDEATRSLVTEQETSQPNREALQYWATGLEVIYLEGAPAASHRRG